MLVESICSEEIGCYVSSTRGLSRIYRNLLIQFLRVTVFFHSGLALPHRAKLVGLRIWLIAGVGVHYGYRTNH